MNALIKEAIKNRQRILVTYNGAERIVEPHAYGTDKNGNFKLRAYQIGEDNAPLEQTGWRLFNETAIEDVKALETKFVKNSSYKKDDKVFQDILAQV